MKVANMRRWAIVFGGVALCGALATSLMGSHSWGSYHWARTGNPFTLKVGDNVNSTWDPYLVTAANDWTASPVLDLSIVPGGTSPRNCRATSGRIEVCNSTYGGTGWLGIAQIWISGSHITQAVAKMNDTYFNKAAYNTPAWRQLVMCQEVAHDFGLGHQDENFTNANLDSCMDYTNSPGSNQHPDEHDYEQLGTIYAHLDSTTTVASSTASAAHPPAMQNMDFTAKSTWGKLVARSKNGLGEVYEQDFGGGHRVVTHVFWAPGEERGNPNADH